MKTKYLPAAALLAALAVAPSAQAYTAGPITTASSGKYAGPSMPGVHHLKKNSQLLAGETIVSQQVTTTAADENGNFTMNCPSGTKVAGFVPAIDSGQSLPSDDGNWGGNPGITALTVKLHGTGTSTYYLLCDISMVYKFDTFDYAAPPVQTPKLGAWILPPGSKTKGNKLVVGTYLDNQSTANVVGVLITVMDGDSRVFRGNFKSVKYGGGPMVTRNVKVKRGHTYKVIYDVNNNVANPSIQRRIYKTKVVK